MKVIFDLPE